MIPVGDEQITLHTKEARRIAAMVDRMKESDRKFMIIVCKAIYEDYEEKKGETK